MLPTCDCLTWPLKPATYHDDDNLYDHDFSRLGRDGPLHVSHAELVPELQPFRDALSKAWTSMGHPLGEDIYSGKMEGLVHCDNTIYKGVRSNSSVFVSTKSNVDVMPLTVCTRINFQGNTAASVTVLGQDNSETVIYAKREIIVSAGVFETPKLLLLSGIGPRKELARHAIQPVVVSEHVGENLLDNPILPHVFRLKDGFGLDRYLLPEGPKRSDVLRRYHEDGSGPLASGLLEMVAFPRIDSRLNKYETYRKAKEKNEDKDPFGPEGQPNFEIDFVVSLAHAWTWICAALMKVAHVRRCIPVALPHPTRRRLAHRDRGPCAAALEERIRKTELPVSPRATRDQPELLLQ